MVKIFHEVIEVDGSTSTSVGHGVSRSSRLQKEKNKPMNLQFVQIHNKKVFIHNIMQSRDQPPLASDYSSIPVFINLLLTDSLHSNLRPVGVILQH